MWTWLRSFAKSILGKTAKPDHLDTATRMARDADFSDTGETSSEPELARKVDPIGELIRIVGQLEPRAAATPFQGDHVSKAAFGPLAPLSVVQLEKPQDDVGIALASAAQRPELLGDGRLDPDHPLAIGVGFSLIADAAKRRGRGDRVGGVGRDGDADHEP